MDAKTYYEKELRKYNNSELDLRSPDEFSIDCMISFAKEMNGKLLPEPKTGQKLTDVDVFYLITQKKGWRKKFKYKQQAAYFKKSFLQGTMNQVRKDKIFWLFGFRRVGTIYLVR